MTKSLIRASAMSSVAASVMSKTGEYARMDASQASQMDQLRAANMGARQLIVNTALRRQQQIFSQTFNPTAGVVLNIQPRYTGLILGFWIEIEATVAVGTNNGVATAWGPANLLQQIRFDDLSNNTRIQTTGVHLNAVNSMKARSPNLAVRTNTAYPIGYGNTFNANIMTQTTPLTTGGGFVRGTFWMPLAYSELDLRGAIYASVVNATMNMQLTLATSAQAFAAAAADPTSAVYQYDGTGATGVISAYTVKVHQVYYDQLPVDKNGAPILPVVDLSTIYELKNTTVSGMVANTDFPIPYSNFRSFLSTMAIFDNVTAGAYPAAGSDVAYWALQSANFTNIFKYQPWFAGIYARKAIGDDFPLGCYVFDSRDKPINTIQFGNMELVGNFSTVNTGASVRMGYEDFAITNTLVGAASLAGGAG